MRLLKCQFLAIKNRGSSIGPLQKFGKLLGCNCVYILIGVIFILSDGSVMIQADSSIINSKKNLVQIKKRIQQNKQKLNPKKIEKKNAEKKLFIVQKELKYTKMKLVKTQEKLMNTQQKKKQTQQDIKQLSKRFEINKDELADRIQQIYKVNKTGLLSLLFLPNSMNQAREATVYFEQILQQDIQLINQIEAEYQQLSRAKEALDLHSKSIEKLERDILKQKHFLIRKETQKREHIQKLNLQIARIEKQNKELEESSKQIEALINKVSKKNKIYWGTGIMMRPASGWLSSRFGIRKHPIAKKWIRHNGIDIAARKGTRIYAADSGKILFAGQKKHYRGYGKIIIIDHGKRKADGRSVVTFYAHASRIMVKTGQPVKKGDEIGLVGDTGYATGPHLHFEVRENGKPVNPLKYIKL